MAQITVNSYELSRSREELAGLFGSLDSKRPTAWRQYGYAQHVTFEHLMTAYQRGGAGHGAIHRILDKCWQGNPRIKQPASDKKGPWEVKVSALIKSIGGWGKLRDLDRRNMVGRYAALIYRVRDGLPLRDPLQTASELVDLIPVYEDQIKVTAWFSDVNADNFGQPSMYQYRMRNPTHAGEDVQGRPDKWEDLHPSRVQILAEGSVGDMFDGVPLMLAGFNHLVDIEKIAGGSAESYLKNSARTLVFKYDKDASVQAITQNADGSTSAKSVREIHEEQTRALNRNQDSSIVIQGGEASALQTPVSDPSGAFQIAANLFAASVQMPFAVLFGQQTGRLASGQDRADMAARCASRQANTLTPMLIEFVTRMQAAGVIDAGEFEIEWPAADAPSDKDKVDLLDKLASAMQKAFAAGLTEPLFDANELRQMVGFEPRTDDGMPTEADAAAALALAAPQPPP
jgi:hypothetical protein